MIDSSLKRANILIVDDQEANVEILESFLEMEGYSSIKTTTDPRLVMNLYALFRPDLILLDLTMPFLSGFEVMKQLKEVIPQNTFFPILVLTADVSMESKTRALSGGATDFLTKPFDLTEVGLRIRNLLYTHYLQQQLQDQNLLLEEKVKERTAELEKRNLELIVAKEKAEASDNLKSMFINNISHEIRTPLNGILGFSQILLDTTLTPPEKEEYLALLNESSTRLINTVTNFMDISKINSGNQNIVFQQVDLNILVKSLADQFLPLCRLKSLELNIQAGESETSMLVTTDGGMVRKILYQLIDNAFKFTRQGSVSISYKKIPDFIQFTVEDTGIGIVKENQTRIFESFVQENASTTRGYEGSGLGLSIAKGFLSMLGGEIWLESGKNGGTTVRFNLPVMEEKTQTSQSEEETEEYIKI